MKRKINEWLNIQVVKNPGRVVLAGILLFNIIFFLISSLIISSMPVSGTENMPYLEAIFCTITMILDAGCIQFVVADIGESGVALVIICLVIIFIGMISFTGAVIGYVTNFISGFIDNANSGSKKLIISDHIIILNWNSRASEIINDLLYCEDRQKVVVLVSDNKDAISKQIKECLEDTIARESKALIANSKGMNFVKRYIYLTKNTFKNKVTFVVREGDVFSSKQLHDISLERAKTIIILGNDINNSICKFEYREKLDNSVKGNPQTIKTLMQVADIASAEYSADRQKIIVEITDDWTDELVRKIIKWKQVDGKCNIVPIRINVILGQLLSQFSLMPELNLVYNELFSNKGATFYSKEQKTDDINEFIFEYFKTHKHAIPLTFMEYKGNSYTYYCAKKESSIDKVSVIEDCDFGVKLNQNYWIEQKTVIILGHNSKSREIMKGFAQFVNEWGRSAVEILNIVVIDNQKSLEKLDYYRDYPFVSKTVAAEIYDRELICTTIEEIVANNTEDTSVLILSDDAVINEDIDANALANLVYVQDIIKSKLDQNPDFDMESIDVIVEIIDPKHHDIVNSYSINNVVISNRYISKMITQIGEKEAMYDFYSDILTYDDDGDAGEYESKEIYSRRVKDFFDDIPSKCTATQLIRAVYSKSVESEHMSPTIVLGYVKPGGKLNMFFDSQDKIICNLEINDKIIVFCDH